MQHFKSIHLLAGILGLVIFVLTGQYMAIVLRGLVDLPDGPRLLYRTSHLYLMWSSLLNLVVGYYFLAATQRAARNLQALASVALLAGLPLILLGFFLESPANDLSRRFCGIANYLALGGAVLHVIATASDAAKRRVGERGD
jgi:hypothetical protein